MLLACLAAMPAQSTGAPKSHLPQLPDGGFAAAPEETITDAPATTVGRRARKADPRQ